MPASCRRSTSNPNRARSKWQYRYRPSRPAPCWRRPVAWSSVVTHRAKSRRGIRKPASGLVARALTRRSAAPDDLRSQRRAVSGGPHRLLEFGKLDLFRFPRDPLPTGSGNSIFVFKLPVTARRQGQLSLVKRTGKGASAPFPILEELMTFRPLAIAAGCSPSQRPFAQTSGIPPRK